MSETPLSAFHLTIKLYSNSWLYAHKNAPLGSSLTLYGKAAYFCLCFSISFFFSIQKHSRLEQVHSAAWANAIFCLIRVLADAFVRRGSSEAIRVGTRETNVRVNYHRYMLLLIDSLPVPALVFIEVGNLNSNQNWLLNWFAGWCFKRHLDQVLQAIATQSLEVTKRNEILIWAVTELAT